MIKSLPSFNLIIIDDNDGDDENDDHYDVDQSCKILIFFTQIKSFKLNFPNESA